MKKPNSNNKHTMKNELLFAGLDVHAQNIAIALAEGGGGEARIYGSIPNDLHAVEKVFAKLRKAHPGCELRVCYEAGPTGFVLARRERRSHARPLPRPHRRRAGPAARRLPRRGRITRLCSKLLNWTFEPVRRLGR
jgi:hypothetical protein